MSDLTIYLEAMRGGAHEGYNRGTVVAISVKGGLTDCVITSTRIISKGRRAGQVEYHLAPIERTGKVYAFKVVGSFQFKKPRGTYTKAQIEAAIQGKESTEQAVGQRKHERQTRGREALGDIDYQRTAGSRRGGSGTKIAAGDEVLVNYKSGKKWERVAFVNFKTGKVAIYRRGFTSTAQERDDILMALMGKKPARGNKDIRYIHPDFIVDVRKGTAP